MDLILPNFRDAFESFPLNDECESAEFERYFEIAIKRDLPKLIVEKKLAGDRIFLENHPKFVAFLSHCMEVELTESVDNLIQNVELIYVNIPSFVCWGLTDQIMPFWPRLTANLRARLMILAIEYQQIDLFHVMASRTEPCDDLQVINHPFAHRIELTPLIDRVREFTKEDFDALSDEALFHIIQTMPTSANLKHYARQIYTDRNLTNDFIVFFRNNREYLQIFLEHLQRYYYDLFHDQLKIREKYSIWIDELLEGANPRVTQLIHQHVVRDQYKIDLGHSKYYKEIWRPNFYV
jgi:hypothetical protein